MKLQILIIGQILFCCQCLAATVPKSQKVGTPSISNENDVVDMIVDTVKVLMVQENMDPIDLPDKRTSADFGPMEFAIEMDKGKMRGLRTLTRTGDSTIEYDHSVHLATIQAALGLENTNITYHMDFEASVLSVGCEMSATATDVSVGLVGSFCLDGSCEARVEDLSINDVSYTVHVSVNIPGHKYVTDWIVDWVSKLFTNRLFKEQINEAIEEQLKKVFLEALSRLHI